MGRGWAFQPLEAPKGRGCWGTVAHRFDPCKPQESIMRILRSRFPQGGPQVYFSMQQVGSRCGQRYLRKRPGPLSLL